VFTFFIISSSIKEYCYGFIIFYFQERGYKLANRPEAAIANEKAKVFESAYFNLENNHRIKS